MSPTRAAAKPKSTAKPDDIEIQKIKVEKDLSAKEAALAAAREIAKLEREHELAVALAAQTQRDGIATLREQSAIDLLKAQWEGEHALHKAYHDNVAEVAKGAIDRTRNGAEFLEKAAVAIVGFYTSLLALVFSVTSNPLPRRGVYPAMFFGLAIAGAAAYLAFLRRAAQVPGRAPGSTLRETQENRTFFFSDWVAAGVFSKRYALRVGVLALMMGVVFLPAPFVAEPTPKVSNGIELADLTAPKPDEGIDDEELRAERFRAELDTYRDAAAVAIERAAETPAPDPDQSSDVERAWLRALLLGLAFCLVGPLVYGWIADRDRTRADGASTRSRPAPLSK